jgi:hypothetical protein
VHRTRRLLQGARRLLRCVCSAMDGARGGVGRQPGGILESGRHVLHHLLLCRPPRCWLAVRLLGQVRLRALRLEGRWLLSLILGRWQLWDGCCCCWQRWHRRCCGGIGSHGNQRLLGGLLCRCRGSLLTVSCLHLLGRL